MYIIINIFSYKNVNRLIQYQILIEDLIEFYNRKRSKKNRKKSKISS